MIRDTGVPDEVAADAEQHPLEKLPVDGDTVSGHSGRFLEIAKLSLLTQHVTSPPSIDALRKLYSMTSSVMARRLGRNIRPARKRPSILQRVG